MDKFVLDGVHPTLDGEYEVDLADLFASLTNREWHILKKEAGVRRGEFREALAANDNDVTIVLVSFVLARAGKRLPTLDPLWDATDGEIRYIDGEAEMVKEVPPTQPPSGDDFND